MTVTELVITQHRYVEISTLDFTQNDHEMWKIQVKIHLFTNFH